MLTSFFSYGRVCALVALFIPFSGTSGQITVPGNTGYSLPDPDAIKFRSKGGVEWSDAAQTLHWYGKFAKTGSLRVQAKMTMLAQKDQEWELRVGEVRRRVKLSGASLPSAGQEKERPAPVEIDLGEVAVGQLGYQDLSLSVVSPNGVSGPVASIDSLTLSGPASEGVHFNTEPRRNASSVHLSYKPDVTEPIEAFYNEVTAVTDPVYTFYMACGFSRGYFGMQVNHAQERRIIFSVWDAAEGGNADDRSTVKEENHTQLLEKGDGVHASVFGHEGTGGHSHLKYLWKTGEVQKFHLTAKVDGTNTIYTGRYFHPEKKEWMLIASFKAPKDGKLIRGVHSFSENFGGSNGHLLRKCLYGPAWVQSGGNWSEIVRASFSHDPTGKTARLDRFMGVENDRFFLSHGGFTDGFVKFGEPFTRKGSGAKPQVR